MPPSRCCGQPASPRPTARWRGRADEAETAAAQIGPCVVKAQVPTGKRGKAGGIKLAADAAAAKAAAAGILGMTIGEHRVATVLVEAQVPIAREMYAAVLNDPASQGAAAAVLGRGRHGHRGDRRQSIRMRWCACPSTSAQGLDSAALRGALPQGRGPCDRDALDRPAAASLRGLCRHRCGAGGDQSPRRHEGRPPGRARLQARRSTTAACRGARRWPSRARPRS